MRLVAHAGPLEGLAEAWQALYERDARATPFMTPGWILAWWRDDARVARPLTLEVRDADGRLAGLAPLAIRRQGPIRVLFGAGAGVGNYWDVLAAEEHRERVSRLVAAELVRRAREWDAFVLDRSEAGSWLPRALADAGLRIRTRPPLATPCIPLPATFDEYLATISRRWRGQMRRALRTLDAGEVELHEPRDPVDIAGAVAHWHELRLRWWAERGREINADHARPGFARFTTEVMQALVPRGEAQVLELHHEGRRIGVKLNLLDDRTVYSWLAGFEPDVARLGPGTVMLGASIRAAIAAGRRTYDFMVGREEYKYHWGAVDRWLPYLVAGSGRPGSGLILDALRVRDALRAGARARAAATGHDGAARAAPPTETGSAPGRWRARPRLRR